MVYRNKKTGDVLELNSVVFSPNFELIEESKTIKKEAPGVEPLSDIEKESSKDINLEEASIKKKAPAKKKSTVTKKKGTK